MNLISAPTDLSSKDLPLRDDVRLLGRILGDTLREQEGEESFQLIESVRRAAVQFRKTQDDRDRVQLEQTLNALSPSETLAAVRPSATFHNCPTSPKTCITTAVIAPTSRPAARRKTAACCWRWSASRQSISARKPCKRFWTAR
jgi:hypothetical protein